MREPRDTDHHASTYFRITPACAGTTSHSFQNRFQDKDHPRVCGNHGIQSVVEFKQQGSPPRVREPLIDIHTGFIHEGITPACAGTTSCFRFPFHESRDHPRVCGNHTVKSNQSQSESGSPPRVREPLETLFKDSATTGITPACAGTTLIAAKYLSDS